MTIYLAFVAAWTAYMAAETYVFVRPQSRPHVVGFLISHALLAPLSFVISAIGGVLRDRVEAAYRAAFEQKEDFEGSGRKTLIG
jgi:hypothetical protein